MSDEVLSWDEIRAMAQDLEISSEDLESGVKLRKYEGPHGWFADSEDGRRAAADFLEKYRGVVEAKDRVAGNEPPMGWLHWLFG